MFEVAHAQVQAAGEVASETGNQLTQLLQFILTQLPLWFAAMIILIISFVIARMVKNSVENKLTEEGFEEEHKEVTILAGRTANATVIIIGITIALKVAGIDLTAIIAAGAFGVGFALQDIIMNFIAGVMILSSRHYAIGDIIKVDGIIGKIVEIQTRATIVKNFDGTKVVIPNSHLFKNPVTSFTSNPFRRISVITGVEYGTDLKAAMGACLKAAKESRNALIEPKPSVIIVEFSDSSINLKTNVWVESAKGILKTRTDLIFRIKQELDAVGINIPFPIRTIVYDTDSKREMAEKMAKMAEEYKKIDALNEVEVTAESAAPEPVTAPVSQSPQKEITTENAPAPQWLQNAAQSVPAPSPEVAPASQAAPTAPVSPIPAVNSTPAQVDNNIPTG